MDCKAHCSFGKDSIAAVLVAAKLGYNVTELIHFRPMFDESTPADYPEHIQFVDDVAIPYFEKIGINTRVVKSQNTYYDMVYKYGFPTQPHGWCIWLKNSGINVKYPNILGMACDEYKRATRWQGKALMPLVEAGITEAGAKNICIQVGLLSPVYDYCSRNGCWYCNNQKMQDYNILYQMHPELMRKLAALDCISKRPFRTNPDYTVSDLIKRAEFEKRQLKMEL